MNENCLYEFLNEQLQSCFVPVRVLKATDDHRITMLRHPRSGRLFVLREFAGDPSVYRRLIPISCPYLPPDLRSR